MSSPGDPLRRSRLRPTLTRVAPWLVALAILAIIVARVPGAELARALARVSVWQLGLLAALFVVSLLLVDSLAIWLALRAVLGEARDRYATVLRVRGASYLLSMVSYAAGQGGIVYLLRRHAGVAVTSGAGAVLLSTGTFLLATALLVAGGLLFGALPGQNELTVAAFGLLAGALVYLVVVAAKPRFLSSSRWLAPFFTAGIAGTLRVTGARLVHMGVLVTGHYTAMRLFGIDVPIATALVGLPMVFLIASLPISPAGLGTSQVAAVTLFSSFASGATESVRQAVILAYSLAFQIVVTLLGAFVALLCLQTLQRSSKLD